MAGLLYLESGDFHLEEGTKGNILCTGIKGISLILFFSPQCQHCQNLIPIFKRLPGQMSGIQFGIVNISVEKNLVRFSKGTATEIRYVPYILHYVNGSPYIRFDPQGSITEMMIKNFIMEVVSSIQKKSQFLKEQHTGKPGAGGDKHKKHDHHRDVPLYSIAQPLYGDSEVTYLMYDEAYTGPDKR